MHKLLFLYFPFIKITSKNLCFITETPDNKKVKIGYLSLESFQRCWKQLFNKSNLKQKKTKNSSLIRIDSFEEFQSYGVFNKAPFMLEVAALGLGEREIGSCCSMGIEFQSCQVTNFQRSIVQRCAVKNCQEGRFYVMCFLPQFFKKKWCWKINFK